MFRNTKREEKRRKERRKEVAVMLHIEEKVRESEIFIFLIA